VSRAVTVWTHSWGLGAAVGVRHDHTRHGLLSMVISGLKRRGGG
jgi:hypothetical protein